jgi:ribosomal-protein-alanine N-acetyltransferase
LQSRLEYADPKLPSAAIDGPFVGTVAVERGRVVGYAIAFPGAEATLAELVVHPNYRRRGHGRALVDAIETTTDPKRLVVTTPAGNRGSHRFYESLGFAAAGRLRGFYGDGTDALRFVLGE